MSEADRSRLLDYLDHMVEAISRQQMRGMRNRMAHGYFDIDLDVVWDTVQASLPALLRQLVAITESR